MHPRVTNQVGPSLHWKKIIPGGEKHPKISSPLANSFIPIENEMGKTALKNHYHWLF